MEVGVASLGHSKSHDFKVQDRDPALGMIVGAVGSGRPTARLIAAMLS